MKKSIFYILSFTWGLPMTAVGALIALAMLITKHKPKRWGHSIYFEIDGTRAGFGAGMFFVIGKDTSTYLKNHEFGHGIQNCYFGFLTPFLVTIPSVIRYWYREFRAKHGVTDMPDYYSIWFERQASEFGCYHYLKEW